MITHAEQKRTLTHEADICVIGGGIAGITVALAASRHGSKVALIQDRPVLGGNASSECRVHICGADVHNAKKNMRETGILEELRMENLYRNPNKNFSVWDTILYEKLTFDPNITMFLNCTVLDAETEGARITSVTGWQLTTYTYQKVNARIFVDCSGDAILAPLVGAAFRMGREAKSEFNETIGPDVADTHTMGLTCLFQAREYDTPQPFIAPEWANVYERCEQLPCGPAYHQNWREMGYWWIELGGEHHTIHDTETLRDELLKITYGVWDHIKNRCDKKELAENWALDWIQFLPAKRESRRYEGAHMLTQLDVQAEGKFDDIVAYGGWPMDDHHYAGFLALERGEDATIFHHAPSPYGIPYRALYSKDVENLMFAGRNASATHAAMSSTRVMGTAASMGQAVGTAAAYAIEKGILPADVTRDIRVIQQALLHDDAYIPFITQAMPKVTTDATLTASQGDAEVVRNGVNRPVGDVFNGWECAEGDTLTYTFAAPTKVTDVTLIVKSALDKHVAMSSHQKDTQFTHVPDEMLKTYTIDVLKGDAWETVYTATNNYDRHNRIAIDDTVEGVRFTAGTTWGDETAGVFAFYVS